VHALTRVPVIVLSVTTALTSLFVCDFVRRAIDRSRCPPLTRMPNGKAFFTVLRSMRASRLLPELSPLGENTAPIAPKGKDASSGIVL